MRTIKFRGLRTDGKGWVYGGYFQHTPDEDGVRYYIFDFNEGAVEVIPESVGQFTGLHDKKGKEIYEGDMLRDDNTDEDILIEDYSVVVWDEKFCQWAIDNSFAKDGSSFTNLVEYFGRETFEIIGNVFENPDLVKL
jgi:uncharacterized phage protein (TIGR01671 family)